MKCIQCNTDNTLKDRTDHQGRCKSCQHRFVFEPTQMPMTTRLTDPMFAKILLDASANGSLFFTFKQLLYFLDRRLRSKGFLGVGGWIAICLFLILFFTFAVGSFLASIFGPQSFIGVALVLSGVAIQRMYGESQSDRNTPKQRRASASSMKVLGAIILVCGFISLMVGSFLWFAASVLLGMFAIYLGTVQKNRQNSYAQTLIANETQVRAWLTQWESVNGTIAKLLPAEVQMPPATISPDVSAYSFDRLVVCQSDTIAHLLIANNFHFENNCAILSIHKYPQNIFDTTMEMLRRNPDLKVFAFHDCSPDGVTLVSLLQSSPTWFQNQRVTIVDVGISPLQVLRSGQNLCIQNSPNFAQAARELPIALRAGLLPAELQWLELGNFVELESLTPERLIQALNHGIAGSRNLESGSSEPFIFAGDSGGIIFAPESFG
jgi:DNA-directed RNA polymerase subunit RPC12/RpoP